MYLSSEVQAQEKPGKGMEMTEGTGKSGQHGTEIGKEELARFMTLCQQKLDKIEEAACKGVSDREKDKTDDDNKEEAIRSLKQLLTAGGIKKQTEGVGEDRSGKVVKGLEQLVQLLTAEKRVNDTSKTGTQIKSEPLS